MMPPRLPPALRKRLAHRSSLRLLVLIACTPLVQAWSASHTPADTSGDSHADAAFGRLFFTPAERRMLDLPPPPPPPPPRPVRPASPPAAPPQRIDGFLRHSSGETILWLDGEPGPLPAGLRTAPFPALELIPAHDPRQRLRTGDRWQGGADPHRASAEAMADVQPARQPE